ncbi:PAS domain-containing hybrid sensor histidine kinase/response regulator [Aquicella siphonis]|nr:PAS domain-containing hybrid sensor histidine kinase/response regulator [Aquicella siphonis]
MKSLSDSNILNLGKYFYKLAECSQDVFWIRDVDYKTHLYISPVYEQVWGLTCQSLYENSESWLTTVHPKDRERVENGQDLIRLNPVEGRSYSLAYRIIRPDGELRRIEEVNFPIFDTNQHLIGFAGVAKDVTVEKLRLAELEQASKFFRFFAEKIHAVFWARDDSCNKQLYLSPGYEKVWGRSRESLYANPDSWLDTLHPEDREKASNVARFETLEEMGQDVQYEYRYRIFTPEGEIRWIKDTSFPIQNEDNKFIGFAGIAEDITKEVLHEKKLREAMQRAEVANQAKSDFLAMISHELRTPLNAILGMAQILKTRGLPPDLDEYVDIISNAGNGLLSLVSDILDFARLEAGKLSFSNDPFDLHRLISQIVHSLQYQAREKNIDLMLDYRAEDCNAVIGDANRVKQVMLNLLGNALKFTEQGYIKVLVNCRKKTKNKAVFEISVTDTGVGIKREKLESIFEKFSQIDSIYHRKHGGIGLGLAITKQLVETMGGEIQVNSEYGKGSEFRFTLHLKLQPGSEEKVQKPDPAIKLQASALPQYPMHVLLVEDNVINQKIAKVMLEDFGCRVDIVDNGQKVMERIGDLIHYDIIFMDVGLPDISGFDIVSKLRAIPKLVRVPVVAMTAHILERDRQQAIDAGMNHMIPKPISYEDIASVLEEYSRRNNPDHV